MARDKLRDDIKRLGHSPGTPNADEFSYHNHLPEENYHALLTRLATWRTGDRPRHPLPDLSLTSPFQAEVHVVSARVRLHHLAPYTLAADSKQKWRRRHVTTGSENKTQQRAGSTGQPVKQVQVVSCSTMAAHALIVIFSLVQYDPACDVMSG
jgi:hypothetical protein